MAWKTDVGMPVFGAVLADRAEQVQGSEQVHWAIARWVKLDEPFALMGASCRYRGAVFALIPALEASVRRSPATVGWHGQ